ncbi:MAG: hypothetical protein QOF33_2810 [Thermomicrobiales bacterium]|nr:hypothetical protein [Thermomicrobiales bacterium]
MDTRRFDALGKVLTGGQSRRTALGRFAAGGLAAAALAAVGTNRRAAAQGAAPAGWRTEHLEFDVTPQDPVTIPRAGSGPPQRGDWFYVDAPIYAAGDVGGTQIGTYQCFGAWTHASNETAAHDLRLTTVQFQFDDGNIMGLINELGADPTTTFGAVQGGTGAYIGALGTFQQLPGEPPATPSAGTPPAVVPNVVRTTFDLILPNLG